MLWACQWPLLGVTGRADFAGEGGEVAGCSAWGGRRGSGAGMRGAELRGPPGAARREAVCGGPREGGIPRRRNVGVVSKFGKDSVSHDVEMRGRVGSPAFLSLSHAPPRRTLADAVRGPHGWHCPVLPSEPSSESQNRESENRPLSSLLPQCERPARRKHLSCFCHICSSGI